MKRKEITELLTETLINDRLSDRKYYAQEVTLDYGTSTPRRIDVLEFRPKGVTHASDIEKGIFVCYEVKSCVADVYSGRGLNFCAEKNYLVTTMATYKKLQEDIRSGKLQNHIREYLGEGHCPHFGVMVAVPSYTNLTDTNQLHEEYEKPHGLVTGERYKMYTIYPQPRENSRKRSMNELLFCMLRSKHSYTNQRAKTDESPASGQTAPGDENDTQDDWIF